jgi:hypothetical protein
MIWCDLDNTLIWTWEPLITSPLLSATFGLPVETKPPCGKGRRRLTRVEVPELGSGYVCCRRSAVRFLGELRRLDRVKMLTSALRCYATAMNAIFDFGFGPDDIVTRENLRAAKPTGADPRAVLIDNEPRFLGDDHHHAARLRKFRYLGIAPSMVVDVPYFEGDVDDPFESNWQQCVGRVRALLEKERA